jgi:hypothetical protein
MAISTDEQPKTAGRYQRVRKETPRKYCKSKWHLTYCSQPTNPVGSLQTGYNKMSKNIVLHFTP